MTREKEWGFLCRIGLARECNCLLRGRKGVELKPKGGGVSIRTCPKCGGDGYVKRKSKDG
jgi:hypothetical protein